MPLLKFFICAGLLLTFALYGLSEYLEPSATRAESVSAKPPATGGEAFRPTPAPPVIEAAEIPLPAEATPDSTEAIKATEQTKTARQEPKRRKPRLTARRPEESRAKFANDGAAPRLFGFFNWR